ncbi:GNAT family N-acetyltransferase [Pelagicoccus sp. NFK12]|uniref:GNAT family N-acetyltransferase n=1 Tax=Pelagicoccus enzymogenes TaxID=2773457 RepID=A0A927F7K0_9BACT|nr:GNAT family N-acetyltransferase [Pelagicoccus enzymogenes]MBD5779814.1 GNAT family N-acetyltransferase [Pelagicoccus enzymogenes]
MNLTYTPATEENFDELVELRIEAMKESLEAIGRFDRDRSIERFRRSFRPNETQIIKKNDETIGFIAVSKKEDHFLLDHLYISPDHQSFGYGSKAIEKAIDRSEESGLPIRLGALRSSRSNGFYQRHGFTVTSEDEFDIYYERKTRANKACHTTPASAPR